jgi:hypothetical protein
MTLKIATLFALGLTLVAHDALAEEPVAKPEPVTVERSSPGDRAALRAELRREAIAAHTELRQERAEGRAARPEGPARPLPVLSGPKPSSCATKSKPAETSSASPPVSFAEKAATNSAKPTAA